jgi:hypothetical protein
MPTDTPKGRKLVPLYPTRSRLSLLRLVRDGAVYEPTWEPRTFRVANAGVVTSLIRGMHRAGWVKLTPATRDAETRLRQVVLDDLGARILAKDERKS